MSHQKGNSISKPRPADGIRRFERYEIKYAISYPTAYALREYLEPYMEPDSVAIPEEDGNYTVASLYLDTPDFYLAQTTLRGEMDREKLRIRRYGPAGSGGSLYFEVKGRRDQVIVKRRGVVKRESGQAVLSGHSVLDEHLVKPDPESGANVAYFQRLMDFYGAIPRAWILYRRLAFMGRHCSSSSRVTFDMGVMAAPPGASLDLPRRGWLPVCDIPVILEIKFTETWPAWLLRIIRVFELHRRPASKYVMGIQALLKVGAVRGGREICLG